LTSVYKRKIRLTSYYFVNEVSLSPLSKDETRRDNSLTLTISHYTVIKTMFMYFVYGSLGREDGCRCDRCNVIPSLEFKACMTIKSEVSLDWLKCLFRVAN